MQEMDVDTSDAVTLADPPKKRMSMCLESRVIESQVFGADGIRGLGAMTTSTTLAETLDLEILARPFGERFLSHLRALLILVRLWMSAVKLMTWRRPSPLPHQLKSSPPPPCLSHLSQCPKNRPFHPPPNGTATRYSTLHTGKED